MLATLFALDGRNSISIPFILNFLIIGLMYGIPIINENTINPVIKIRESGSSYIHEIQKR